MKRLTFGMVFLSCLLFNLAVSFSGAIDHAFGHITHNYPSDKLPYDSDFVTLRANVWQLMMGVFLPIALLFLPQKQIEPLASSTVSGWRIIIAFMINFFTLMFAAMPITFALLALIEYFSGNPSPLEFSRYELYDRDYLLIRLGWIIHVGGLIIYYSRTRTMHKPTVGHYIMGYARAFKGYHFEEDSIVKRAMMPGAKKAVRMFTYR